MRTQYGIERTECACSECAAFCQFMPGYLIPADLVRIIPKWELDDPDPTHDPLTWAESNLLASPGALVSQAGRPFRIHTLVPARQESGACIHFTAERRCAIHPVAPFGCAFFGCEEYNNLREQANHEALEDVYRAQLDRSSLYCTISEYLWRLGKRAPRPEVARATMQRGVTP
jgi:Fe-S-cluster containining protein